MLCDGEVGAVLSIEASRLARNGRDWHTLLEFCSVVGALLIDAEGIYDPALMNDRLLLGMKGTISEMELASFRQRAHEAIKQKAKRGELFMRVPIGYVRTLDDRIEKDPDERVRAAIELVFRKFAELGSARRLYFWLCEQGIQMPAVASAASSAGVESSRSIAAARVAGVTSSRATQPPPAEPPAEPPLCRCLRIRPQQDQRAHRGWAQTCCRDPQPQA